MTGRIHITGASGAGVTTLGRELARRLQVPSFDVDDYYWLRTNPPFQRKRAVEERLSLLSQELAGPEWILSGSIGSWGEPLVARFTRVIYLQAAVDVRLKRLAKRELELFGPRVLAGGDMHEAHQAFLDWAAAYDDGSQPGRSRTRHALWLAQLSVPVICYDGAEGLGSLTQRAESFVRAADKSAAS